MFVEALRHAAGGYLNACRLVRASLFQDRDERSLMKFYQARQARRGKPGYRMKIASLSSVIVGALKTHLAGVRRTGPASWSCASEAAPAGLTASLQSDWLVLEVRTDGRQREEPCGELLAWNACFAPPAKWVQLPGGGAGWAEVPLEPAEPA